jgi:hypothetical protein
VPATTSTSETRTLPCQRAESRPFSVCSFGGHASGGRDGACAESHGLNPLKPLSVGVSKPSLNGTPGATCCWVSGTLLRGPPPHPGPAVHSNGYTALRYAALHGNRRIVRLLIASNAAVDAQNDYNGYASPLDIGGRAAESPPFGAGPHRCTGLLTTATPKRSKNCS